MGDFESDCLNGRLLLGVMINRGGFILRNMLDYTYGVDILTINAGKEKGGFMEVEIEDIKVTIKLKIAPKKRS
ncbi:hypothetical protein IKE72_01520 [Candidatus Saccharibacteria bacterium]|nr:hypothetical protein [Candidatus Saccharibacteria bacterium]